MTSSSMPTVDEKKSGPAAPAQPPAGEAFNPGLTPGVFSLERDNRPTGRGKQMIPTVEQVLASIPSNLSSGCLALRMLRPGDKSHVGARLLRSWRWDEGDRTTERLPGTCAVGILSDVTQIDRWSDDLPGWIALALKTVALYGDGPVALVSGEKIGHGEDDYEAPEWWIARCRILAIW